MVLYCPTSIPGAEMCQRVKWYCGFCAAQDNFFPDTLPDYLIPPMAHTGSVGTETRSEAGSHNLVTKLQLV